MLIEIPDKLFNKYPSIGIYISEHKNIHDNVNFEIPVAMFDFPKSKAKIDITELEIQTTQDKTTAKCTFNFKSSPV